MCKILKNITDLIKNLLEYSVIRFLFVSGLNTIFGYGLFISLIYYGIPYQVALLISTICGIVFNFKTIGVLVFKNSNYVLFFKFLIVYVIVYVCNILGIKMLVFFGLNVYLSGAMLLFPMGLLAYVLNKSFVFNKREKDKLSDISTDLNK